MHQKYNIKTTSLSRLLVVPHSALKDICQHFMADYSMMCQNLISKLEGIKALNDADREHQQRAVMEVIQAPICPPLFLLPLSADEAPLRFA